MATFTFDGTSSITATKNDTVLISADVQTFTQATDNGSSVSLAFGANTLTITGTTLVSGGLPNVFVTGGTFSYLNTPNTNGAGTGNVLSIVNNTAFTLPAATTATSKVAVFGGLGRVDNADGDDTVHIGGKGSQLVFGNAGADTIDQLSGANNAAVAFDSTSIVNVNGDAGNDTINLNVATNSKASIFVGAGAGADAIAVVNSGTTTIQGGLDSNDGNDTITFNGVGGAAGTSQIFGNGGDDTITVGTAQNALDSTSTTTVYGGFGVDGITVTATKATVNVLGGEGADTITVTNSGNTFITGGLQSGDQSLDGADNITFTGAGNALIYGNVGNDTIIARVGNADSLADTTSISIYGGKDNDTITQTIVANTTGKASVFIAGGEGGDIITANGNGGAVTIYGGISNADATDGADTINYGTSAAGSTGAANIFANGGNDTVNIGTLGNDSTNTVTVYGGGGNDSINVGVQNAGNSTTAQQLVINGNDGSDSITIAHSTTANNVTTTALGQTITISDFTLGTTGDALKITGVTGAAGTTVAVAGGTFQTLQNALDAAAAAGNGANKVGAVAFGGSTYVVVDTNGSGTYTAAADQAIKLTGVTDVFSVANQTTVSAV